MVLHGDVENEVGVSLLRIGDLEDGLIVRLVGDVVADKVGVVHVLLVELVIKAHVVIHDGPVPSRGLIGVKGGSFIAVHSKQGCQGGHPLFGVELVGYRVGRLEDGGEPGEVFKLHTGSTSSGNGGVHPAFNGVLTEGVEEGGRVLRDLQIVKDGQVGEGLIHDHNDIDGLGRVHIFFHTGVLVHQFQHKVMAVIIGLIHRAIPQGHREIQEKAVGLGDPLLGVDPQGRQHSGKEEGKRVADAENPAHDSHRQRQLVPFGLRLAHPRQKQVSHQQHRRLLHIGINGKVKGVGHIGRRLPAGHIGRKQNAAPEAQHIVVYQSNHKTQADGQSGCPAAAPQHQPAHKEQDVIPDQIHQHLPGLQVGKHIVLVEDLHHPEGCPGSQQEYQSGHPFPWLAAQVGHQPRERIAVQ